MVEGPSLLPPGSAIFGDIIRVVSNTDPENVQQVAASQLALSTSYYENVLLQARRSFIAAIASATVGFCFSLQQCLSFWYATTFALERSVQ